VISVSLLEPSEEEEEDEEEEILRFTDTLYSTNEDLDFVFQDIAFVNDEFSSYYTVMNEDPLSNIFLVEFAKDAFDKVDQVDITYQIKDDQLSSGEQYCDTIIQPGSDGKPPRNATACFVATPTQD
jgi:hypothetical protein